MVLQQSQSSESQVSWQVLDSKPPIIRNTLAALGRS